MIGVIAKKRQKRAVREFFELFKVPWEFYEEGKKYDVVILTEETCVVPSSQLLVICCPETTNYDHKTGSSVAIHSGGVLLEYGKIQIPLYCNFVTFNTSRESFITV